LEIDLAETDYEGRELAGSSIEPAEGRWICSWSDGLKYHSACDPMSLGLAIKRFKDFVENRL